MDFLDEIRAELEKVTPEETSIFKPTIEIQEDELPLGRCDEELKKLYVLVNKYSKESVRALRASEGVAKSRVEEKIQWENLSVKKRRQAEAIGDILVLTIRERLNNWNQGIRIRKGWQIVRKPVEERKESGISILLVSAPKDDEKPEKE